MPARAFPRCGKSRRRANPGGQALVNRLPNLALAETALFARLLNVSSNAVESWEQGIREPRQATLKLLHIARKTPGALLD